MARTEKITSTSNKDIYEGLDWRTLTEKEMILITRLEISLLISMDQFHREFANRDWVVQTLIDKLVNEYPETEAEKGFYQTIDYEGNKAFAIHPLAMNSFDNLGCMLHRYARTMKPHNLDEKYRELIQQYKIIISMFML